MSEVNGRFGRYLFWILLVISIVLCVWMLIPDYLRLTAIKKEHRDLINEKEACEQERRMLGEEVELMKEDDYIERVAREELKLVKPGETIYVFSGGN